MKKIDRNNFLAEIFKKSKGMPEDDSIAKIDSTNIREIFIKGKYFYCLDDDELKDIQLRILSKFLDKVELNNAATAFRKNCSYLNFLEPHKDGYYFLRLDISSFFHSIPFDILEDAFSVYFKDESVDALSKSSLLEVFLSYVTYSIPEDSPNISSRGKSILPMGFITSPTISNIIFRKVDIQIQNFCQSHNVSYTRYADDLLFSSNSDSTFVHSEVFEREISILVSLLGLKLNREKTLRKTHTISLNGYTIQYSRAQELLVKKNGTIHISNKKTEIIEKLIFKITVEKNSHLAIMKKLYKFRMKSKFNERAISEKLLEKYASRQLFNKIAGYRSYLISIIVFDKTYTCISNQALEKYRNYIEKLNKILDDWP